MKIHQTPDRVMLRCLELRDEGLPMSMIAEQVEQETDHPLSKNKVIGLIRRIDEADAAVPDHCPTEWCGPDWKEYGLKKQEARR